jgi:hypothetical protein
VERKDTSQEIVWKYGDRDAEIEAGLYIQPQDILYNLGLIKIYVYFPQK